MKQLISIVIPAFNEQENIPELAKQLTSVMNKLTDFRFEIIIVENGSRDQTLSALLAVRKKDSRFKVVQLAKNEGCDGGIMAGLSYATGQAAIIMMADLQDSPALVGLLIKKWQDGYDIVYTIVKKRIGVPLTRRVGTLLFYKMMNYLTRDLLPESSSDFRLLDKRVYQQVVAMPEHNKYFRGLSMWTGFRQTGIAFERPARFAGTSKAHFTTVFKVAADGIFAFSNLPIRIAWLIPILAGICFVFFLITQQFIACIFALFLICLSVSMAIQGEYLLRILTEVRARPSFIVKQLYGLNQGETEI